MTFWTVWTLDNKDNESPESINFLKQKYIHTRVWTRALLPYLNISAFTCILVNYLLLVLVFFLFVFIGKTLVSLPVLSTNTKSSTSTMVYIAGIFHLAGIEQVPNPINFTNTIIHEKPRI